MIIGGYGIMSKKKCMTNGHFLNREAKMIPYKCPVCNGYGTVSKPPSVAGDQPTWLSSDMTLYPCPACDGTGILWEQGGKDG